ncbi:MAG: hypothetical protein IPO63_18210 [Bacteroidetes bacterium]|nr:hypothetical protein [Bacteroidota bacterium]
MNSIYMGIPTSIMAIVENTKCDEYFLTTDNGQISEDPNGNRCNYIFTPQKNGKTTIFINKLQRNDTIKLGEKIFQVKNIPKPIAKIGGMHDGNIRKAVLVAQKGIIATLEDIAFDIYIKISKYSVLIIREKELIYSDHFFSNILTSDFKTVVLNCHPNDQIIFFNIEASFPNMENKNLDSIIFTIEN